MKTLFIDTHSEKITIMIRKDMKTLKREAISDRSHSEKMVSLLSEILDEAALELQDLDEIVVVNGPGSFTGVRIGVTVAKTIAFSLGIPIKTITSMEAYGVSAKDEFDVSIVRDSKGVYSALKIGEEYSEFLYQRNADFDSYIEKNNYRVLEGDYLDIAKILEYLTPKKSVNPHMVNPIYIKEIDALK